MLSAAALCPAAVAEVLHNWRTVLACAAVETTVLANGVGELVVEVVDVDFVRIKWGWDGRSLS